MLLQFPARLIQTPDGARPAQHARRLVMDPAGPIHAFRFFIRDRDAKVTAGPGTVLLSEGARIATTAPD